MTPALQQAIKILQMSSLDLHQEIQAALESNLMLETEDEPVDALAEPDKSAETPPECDDVSVEWEQIYDPAPSTGSGNADDVSDWQSNIAPAQSLTDHLRWQADMTSFAPGERAIADVIIDAIKVTGRFDDWPALAEQLAAEFSSSPGQITAVLQKIQSFDPPGVGARDLAECIGLQLEQLPGDTPGLGLAQQLVFKVGLETMANSDLHQLAEMTATSADKINDAMALIRTCRPDPGEAYQQSATDIVTPELEVRRTDAGWQVSLNDDIVPKIRLNERYLDLIKRGDSSDDQTTLKAHLQEARFFLNSLKSRNETLLQVAECLIKTQRGFLDYGAQALKPLVLRDVAEGLGVHESTVSRATANKYIQTPRGILELKSFFASRVPTKDGGAVSGTAIQAMLQALVADESPTQPLSDSKLAERLNDDGVRVARRTVAKYREALDIAPSRERRRS